MYGQAMRLFAGLTLLAGAALLSRSVKKTYLSGDGLRPFKALYVSLMILAGGGICVCMSSMIDVPHSIWAFPFAASMLFTGLDMLWFYKASGRVVKR